MEEDWSKLQDAFRLRMIVQSLRMDGPGVNLAEAGSSHLTINRKLGL